MICKYSYTAFGITTIEMEEDGIGTLNPIRYKGYYYDNEISMYYCTFRYYSPELCRFISPIDVSELNPSAINGLNLYSYCGNNPYLNQNNLIKHINFDSNIIEMDNISRPVNSKKINSGLRKSHKGVPVFYFEHDDISSFSFGFMFINTSQSYDEDTYNHEYGHTRQFLLLGPIMYFFKIGLPSMLYNLLSRDNDKLLSQYFYMPWEITADIFGNVDRKKENSNTSDSPFFDYSYDIGYIYLILSYLSARKLFPSAITAATDGYIIGRLIRKLLER